MNSHFLSWYEEADIPGINSDGKWEDFETGFLYCPPSQTDRKPRAPVSDKIKEARATAKDFGGKALKGSAKQKNWGESIRAELLKKVNLELARVLASHDIFENASAFIAIRTKSVAEVESMLKTVLESTKSHNIKIRRAEELNPGSRITNKDAIKLYDEANEIQQQLYSMI
tara:strand:+ start:7296 stop:7808 length:513 start_codon:yes stop_codon:yes gene_type:complete